MCFFYSSTATGGCQQLAAPPGSPLFMTPARPPLNFNFPLPPPLPLQPLYHKNIGNLLPPKTDTDGPTPTTMEARDHGSTREDTVPGVEMETGLGSLLTRMEQSIESRSAIISGLIQPLANIEERLAQLSRTDLEPRRRTAKHYALATEIIRVEAQLREQAEYLSNLRDELLRIAACR